MHYDSSSFKLPNILFSLTSFSSCLSLLPRLLLLSVFPAITSFRRQFLRILWPIQLAFICFIVYTWLYVILPGTCTEWFPVPWKQWRRGTSGMIIWRKPRSVYGQTLILFICYWNGTSSVLCDCMGFHSCACEFFVVLEVWRHAIYRSVPEVSGKLSQHFGNQHHVPQEWWPREAYSCDRWSGCLSHYTDRVNSYYPVVLNFYVKITNRYDSRMDSDGIYIYIYIYIKFMIPYIISL